MSRDIAVVGMVCHIPGAKNTDEFWKMLSEGREGLRTLTPEEIALSGVSVSDHSVAAGGYIEGINLFDPEQFGFTARDALYMDPQHRLFLQACSEALEVSGNAGDANRHIGVFASAGQNNYLTNVILKNGIDAQQYQSILLGNVPDCLATRVSYCLNLTGPSMTIQCGCSSSLVGVHQARLALLAKQCDVALVGGISIAIPHFQGYSYIEGGFASPDGHCRPFSEDAAGTVFSSGYGVVVLKRLADAIADGDTVYAILKSSAINNDGADKASFTAPSVQGQTNVIAKALRIADIAPDTIQYIETHGTATPIGDPIEITALKNAFEQLNVSKDWRCNIGSVKANVGHLDVAAGIVGFIKTCLMLHFKKLTPQLHFKTWNSRIPSAVNPFQISTAFTPWEISNTNKRRAGVSAFGFGGTNAHLILEENENTVHRSELFPVSSLVVLSAKSIKRLITWIDTLRQFLLNEKNIELSSLAYTLQVGRRQWPCRISFRVSSINELIDKLSSIKESDIQQCKQSKTVSSITNLSIDAIEQQWLMGDSINWSTAYLKTIQKCSLPSAPLQKASYWLDENVKNEITPGKLLGKYDQWLYSPTWNEVIVPITDEVPSGPLFIIGDLSQSSLQEFIKYIQHNKIAYCIVEPSVNYQVISPTHIRLNFSDPSQLSQLVTQWERDGFSAEQLVHWIDAENISDEENATINQLLAIIKNSKLIKSLSAIHMIVKGMSHLFCPAPHPSLAMLIAFNRGIRQEFPHLKSKLIDIEPASLTYTHCQQIMSSLLCSSLLDFAVWRDGKCWQMNYQSNALASSPHDYFKQNGVYLITGGLGDVASVYVTFLAECYQAKIIVIGRTSIPSRDIWDDLIQNPETSPSLKKKISRLNEWKKKGFSVDPYIADVTSLSELRAVCQAVESTYGQISGVIHIAGAGSDMHYKVLNELTWAHCWALFAPKLQGIEVIENVMTEFSIPNCLFISSISSALAGIGLAAYAASHNLLDAYVMKQHPHWRLMNWDAWNFHLQTTENHDMGALGSGIDKLAITPSEGIAVLNEAFKRQAWQQLFISTTDLPQRVQQWVKRSTPLKRSALQTTQPRPNLRSEYVTAGTPLQKQLVELWKSLLAIETIGIHDNFFELGGDSLLALELVGQLQSTLNYACSIMDLFESGTIAKLAEKHESQKSNKNDRSSMAKARAEKQKAALKQRYIHS